MGKYDTILNDYLNNNHYFADLFNAVCFHGKQVIQEQDLQDLTGTYIREKEEQLQKIQSEQKNRSENKRKSKPEVRIRDLVKQYKNQAVFRILAIENQMHVDYTMPWRCMNYDTMEYGRQIKDIQMANQGEMKKESGIECRTFTKDERISRFHKEDQIIPVYTLCVYYGEEPWGGPRSLKEMMRFSVNDQMEKVFADYPLRLVCLNEWKDFSQFHSTLREVFSALPYRRDKNGLYRLLMENPKYHTLDEESYRVLSLLLGKKKLLELAEPEKGEERDMCQAIDELIEDGRQEGLSQGISQGLSQGIKAMIQVCTEFGLSREETMEKLKSKFSISEGKAKEYLKTYWK